MLITIFDDKLHRLHLYLPRVTSGLDEYNKYHLLSDINLNGFRATNSGIIYSYLFLSHRAPFLIPSQPL